MKTIQIHIRPSLLIRFLQGLLVCTIFIIIYLIFKNLNLEGEGKNFQWGILGIVSSIGFGVFFLKYELILTPRKQIYMNSIALFVTSNGKVKEYPWKDINKLILFFRGVRLFLCISFSNQKKIEFEFSNGWFYSAFNSSKSLVRNHTILMDYYGGLKEFTSRIDLEHYYELIKEYNLTSPKSIPKSRL